MNKNLAHFYDVYIVYFSGGKDSIACVLHLLEIGVPLHKIELWHHNIDGRDAKFMDWNITPAYCQAFADAFGLKIYFSWKEKGFKGEMLRENSLTQPTSFETPEGLKTIGGTRGKLSTRLKFPQVSADLQTRWCSAYLKIDVGAAGISNQERFNGKKVVCISGERAEESTARAKYQVLEKDRADNRDGKKARFVDRWRPVKNWSEAEVWEIIERFKVRVHPCYYMGWGRCSCMFCIFGNADQFASAYAVNEQRGEEVIGFEDQFKVTIKRNMSLRELIALGRPYQTITPELIALANSSIYELDIIMNNEAWLMPAGAFGDSCGPI